MNSPVSPSTAFADGKDPGALRTIGEVAAGLGIKQHILRYWEQQFPMLRPLKRSGGRRYYRPEDVALVETIDRLVNREGFTLKGARQALKNMSGAGSASLTAQTTPNLPVGTQSIAGSASEANLAKLLPQLKAIRERLAQALAV